MIWLFAAASPARADEGSEGPVPLQLHGFASQGFLYTTDNNYLARSERGSFEFAEAAINVTATLSDRLRTGMQLFTRDLGPYGNYRANVDWFYLDYRWKDWLGLRAGRVKLPFGLYNDIADIDAAHGLVLLPQSIYPAQNRDFLLAQTGVELYGYRNLGARGALDYRLYAGTIFLEIEETAGSPVEVGEFNVPYVVGGRLMWEPGIEGLRLGGSLQALRLESELVFEMPPNRVAVDLPAVLWVASLEYTRRRWLLAAEYSRWHVGVETSDPMLIPEETTVSERAYALAAYRARPWLQTSMYYSILYLDVDDRSGRDAKQHDVAATLRFDVSLNWLIKLEAHYMRGTGGLSQSLNDEPLDTLPRDWFVLLAKTTAYF